MAQVPLQEATDWFTDKARTAAGYRKNIISKVDRYTRATVIGKMYFFAYDPKWKAILPIYDKFPVVFPIEPYPDGFLGLNLHYLSMDQRYAILGQLMKFRNNNKLNETTKLRMSYDLLQSTKTLGAVQPCIKRYLFSHVKSEFIEIYADEWQKAISLPVQQFVRKT